MKRKITFALTACGRPDLLERTLYSFFKFNDYPIERFKIIDDSTIKGVNDKIIEKYPQIEWIHNTERLGQSKSLDILFEDITTEFIFHCEDDWEFEKKGFIEKSIEILDSDKKIIQAWIRGRGDTNGHPLIHGEEYDELIKDYGVWHGFSFNPALKRLSDYLLVKPYSSVGWETELNHKYMKELGFYAVSLHDKYVSHIGWGRHIQDAHG
jgi:GT2 family glycosyltransferase